MGRNLRGQRLKSLRTLCGLVRGATGAAPAIVRQPRRTVAPELLHPRTPLVPGVTPGRPSRCDAPKRQERFQKASSA